MILLGNSAISILSRPFQLLSSLVILPLLSQLIFFFELLCHPSLQGRVMVSVCFLMPCLDLWGELAARWLNRLAKDASTHQCSSAGYVIVSAWSGLYTKCFPLQLYHLHLHAKNKKERSVPALTQK